MTPLSIYTVGLGDLETEPTSVKFIPSSDLLILYPFIVLYKGVYILISI